MRISKPLILVFAAVTVLLISFTFYFYQVFFSPNFLVDKSDQYFYIFPEDTFEDIRDNLFEKDYVQDPVSFSFLSKLMKYNENVKSGRYLIEANSNNRTVIRMLRAGLQEPVSITFTNVRMLSELSEKICKNIALSPKGLDSLLLKESTPAEYGFNKATFPCMFIPNTYEVYWDISAADLLERLSTEYDRFWNENRMEKAEALDMMPTEIMTLASIVQAETRHYDESPIIAGLYLNRLERGMLLQADPTLVFAAGDFTIQRVLNIHKEIDSPYNTYKYAGLPPGPINLPSITSIDAVLNAESHNYLYMCAKADFTGYHHFSSRLSDHLQYASKYQKALNKAKLYK